MYRILVVIILFFVTTVLSAQNCFSAFDTMFENGGDTLSAAEFKVREQHFISNLQGCIAPDFAVTSISDNDIVLSALKGKVVVLNFWFIHCPPCRKEIPLLNKLTHQFDSDEVVFIGLARDEKEKLEDFFNRFMPFHYQIIPESYLIADEYKVVAWPQSMIIDRSGKVFKVWAGAGESAETLVNDIQQGIEKCLLE